MPQECPLCSKPVAGESALHGHLEFAHRIDDPILWLEERNNPGRSRRGWRRRRRESDDDATAEPPVDSPATTEIYSVRGAVVPEPEPVLEHEPVLEPESVLEHEPPVLEPESDLEQVLEPEREPGADSDSAAVAEFFAASQPSTPVEPRSPPQPPLRPTAPPAPEPPPTSEPLAEIEDEIEGEVEDEVDDWETEAADEAKTWSSVEADMEALRSTLFTTEERPEESLPLEPDEPDDEPSAFRRRVRIAALVVIFGVLLIAALNLRGDDEPAATTTTTTTTGDPTASTRPPPPEDFRAPFAFDGVLLGCTVEGGNAVHEIGFEFSGAMNITFDGVEYPDRTGNGERTTTRALPRGRTEYVDSLTVFDAVGNEYDVELTPPVFLSGC